MRMRNYKTENGVVQALRRAALVCVSLLAGACLWAQDLILVSGTEFKSTNKGADEAYFLSKDEVTEFMGIFSGSITIGSDFTTPENTDYAPNGEDEESSYSSFLLDDKNCHYAVVKNPVRLDSARMYDNLDANWGIVFSAGENKWNSNKLAMTYTVRGLKNSGKYKVVVEYCNPCAATYLNSSGSNTKPHLSSGYSSSIKVGMNNSQEDGEYVGSPGQTAGACSEKTLESPTSNSSTKGTIAGGELKVNIYINQMSEGEAIAIKSIKIYAEVEPTISAVSQVCAGGENAVLSLEGAYVNCTYQWYRDGVAISGATGISYSHTSGDVEKDYDYYCEITTSEGEKVKSQTFTISDVMCCQDANGKPMSRKLIWQDDFGTFTSKGNYWVWDYTDINEPVKVDKTTPTTAAYSNGWSYALDEGIPGANFVGGYKSDNWAEGKGTAGNEGWYNVTGNVTCQWDDLSGGDGTLWGWQAQCFNGTNPGKNGFVFVPDHTYEGSAYGAMLFLNCGNEEGATIYERTITGLCDKYLTVKCFINTFSNSTNPVKIRIRATDANDLSNVVTSNQVIRYASKDAGLAWKEVSVKIKLTTAATGGAGLKFEIISDGGGTAYNKDGNDLILDDIQIYACSSPSINAYFNLDTYATKATSCDGADVDVYAEVTDMIKNYYGADANYVIQYNPDKTNKLGWKTIGTRSTTSYKKDMSEAFAAVLKADPKAEKIYFRVVLGDASTLDAYADYFNPDEACAAYTVSEVIEATIECPKCTEPKEPAISAKGGTVDKATSTVSLCQGESTVLSTNDITGTDTEGNPYTDYTITWYKGSESAANVVGTTVTSGSKAEDLTVDWADATAAGTKYIVLVHDNFENDAKTTECDKTAEFIVKANPVPTVPAFTIPSFCKGQASTDATLATAAATADLLVSASYSFVITAPDETTTYTSFTSLLADLDALEADATYTIVVTDKATGCVSEPATFDITVNPLPEALVSTDLSYMVEAGKTQTVEDAATAETGNTLEWAVGAKTDVEAPTTGWTEIVPSVSLDADGEYYFWVRQKTASGCIGEGDQFKVVVVSTPVPFYHDTTVCVNSAVDMADLVQITEPTYELQWYTAEEGGTASTTVPTVDVTTAGVQTFYVSQKDTEAPYAESKRMAVNVTVVGVDKPLVTTPINYCKGDAATALTATAVQDKTTQMLADAFVWVSGVTESAEAPVPATTEAGATTYSVYQTYAVTGVDGTLNETCKGEAVDITVNVYETAAPTDATVQYIKANVGADGKTFPTIDQATTGKWAEETGYKYYYSAVSETEAKPTTGYTAGVPAPVYDVSLLSGGTKELYTWVYRESEANAIACSSDTILVKIKISDALPPEAQGVYVCEDGAVPDLTATVSILEGTGKTEADYELRWYTEDPSANPAATYTAGATFSTGITAAVAGIGHKKATYEYYVTQYDLTTFAESSPTEVVVTVWPKPVLEVTDPTPTCETAIDLTKTWTSTNSTEYSSYFTASQTYADADGNPNTGTVETTGTYTVTSSYVLSGTGVTIAEASTCTSEGYLIAVQVDELSIPVITGTTSVCPNESGVQLTVLSETAKPSATYTWAGSQVGAGSAINLNTFGGEKGKTYTYTATATTGVCTKTSEPHTITVGSGQIDGSMTITEADNDSLYAGVEYKNKEQIDIYTCGGEVSLVASYVKDDDSEFEWYKGTGGTYSTTAEATGTTLTIPANATYSTTAYQLRFKNKCDVVINVIVHNIPLTATAVEEDVKKCEGETFSTKVDITCGETPDIRWYRDDVEVKGATEATFTQSSLVETNHEGQYSYEVVNRGCRAKGNAANLDVQRYIRVTPKSEPYIVIRGEQADMQVNITVPESGTVGTATWTDEKGTPANEGVNYTIAAVSDNHDYTIALADDDYCSASTTVSLKVDAKLQMTATLGTVLCYGSSDTLRIDTTGTGNFYRTDIKPSLTVVRTENGVATNLEGDLRKVGNELLLTVSPSTNANYTVTFTYGEQQLVESLDIEVIPAISLTVPDVQTVCEGESVTLTVTDVAPTGTTISWTADPTITSGTDGESITAAPTYTTGTNHTSEYTYVAVAYNEFCGKSKSYDVKVKVDEPLTGSIAGDEKICEGNQSRVDASSYEATAYTWVANGDTIGTSPSMSVKPSETTTYQVLLSRGQCTAEDSHELEVASHPVIISVDSIGVRVRSISTETGRGTTPFTYWVDVETSKQSDQVFYDLKFAQHTAYIRDAVGCETSYDFSLSAPQIIVPDYFTPNGDGINDTWEIGNMVDVYPEAKIQIYDRYGKLLAEYKGSEDGWNGEYNGTKLPSTDYWYVIDIEEIDMQYTGHFTLLRQ